MYTDKDKVAGVNINDPKEKERIYQRYLRAFKKGVYNYIKEESDPITQEIIPRKYFSGGTIGIGMDFAQAVRIEDKLSENERASVSDRLENTDDVSTDMAEMAENFRFPSSLGIGALILDPVKLKYLKEIQQMLRRGTQPVVDVHRQRKKDHQRG